jgi:enolase-phosphatase E1
VVLYSVNRMDTNRCSEVRAAKLAGMQSLVVDRPGNAPLTEQDRTELTVITNFVEIELE